MIRRAFLLLGAGLAAAAALLLAWMLTPLLPMVSIIDRMPSPIRTAYLNNLFNHPTLGCNECDWQMADAVVAMRADLQRPRPIYRFDYAKLAPLIRTNEGFNDPMPAVGCDVMLLSRDRRALSAMARMVRFDRSGVETCVRGGLGRVRKFEPSAFPSVRQALLDEPGLAAFAREEPWSPV